jgi:hypothetical protein
MMVAEVAKTFGCSDERPKNQARVNSAFERPDIFVLKFFVKSSHGAAPI